MSSLAHGAWLDPRPNTFDASVFVNAKWSGNGKDELNTKCRLPVNSWPCAICCSTFMAMASGDDGLGGEFDPHPVFHRPPPTYGVPVLPGLCRPPPQIHATRAREHEETVESTGSHKPPCSYGVRVFPPQPGIQPTQIPSHHSPQPPSSAEEGERGEGEEKSGAEAEKKEGATLDASERLHGETGEPTYQEASSNAGIAKLSGQPVTLVCTSCQQSVTTETKHETGLLTYIAAGAIFFLGGFLGCCLIPFYINKCKDVTHSCPQCGAEAGKFKQLGN